MYPPRCNRQKSREPDRAIKIAAWLSAENKSTSTFRAALCADEIAEEADFFSFGTNDLTQMGFGLSRDDAGKFLGYYQEHGILEKDPFVSIDQARKDLHPDQVVRQPDGGHFLDVGVGSREKGESSQRAGHVQ
jgi:hypothetical protein